MPSDVLGAIADYVRERYTSSYNKPPHIRSSQRTIPETSLRCKRAVDSRKERMYQRIVEQQDGSTHD